MIRQAYLVDVLRYPSLIGAILLNLLPLAGLIYWHWDIGTLVLLYWLENLVVGGVTVLRMSTAGLSGQASDGRRQLVLVPFFVLHYGLFCLVHAAFLETFFGTLPDMSVALAAPLETLQTILKTAPGLPLVLGLIAGWRLTLFVGQFLLRGEFLKTTAMTEMIRPYGRILTMHLAIFAGGIALTAIGQPIWGMVALIIMKGIFDYFAVRKDAIGISGATPATG